MKIKQYILLILTLLGVWSCSTSDTTTTTNIAQLNSFYLASNDSFPGFAEATFTVTQGEDADTGLIYSDDSIRYGTPIERSVPRYIFAATPGYASMRLGDTVITLTGSDTVDLTISPIYLTIISSDKTTQKTYQISTLIHQVDPDLYKWNCLTDYIYSQDDSEQQLVIWNDYFYLYSNNGYSNSLYVSQDGITWTKSPLSGLPDYCRVKSIVCDGQKLYYAKDSLLYISSNASSWTVHNYAKAPFSIHTMLMSYNDTIWSIVEDKQSGKLYLGQVVDEEMKCTTYQLDEHFPISGFCAVEFASTCYRPRAMVIGGYSRNGDCVNSRWNIEYIPGSTTAYRVINYSIEQPTFTTLTGVSVAWYDNKLLMFGGVDKDMKYRGNKILYSQDEGFNWSEMDSTKCALPNTYTARQKQSVAVYNNNIYVIGGQDNKRTYSDVYQGRLNSIDWE